MNPLSRLGRLFDVLWAPFCSKSLHKAVSPGLDSARRPRLELLEDRRMLSVLFVDADAAEGGDGTAWMTALQDLESALSATAEYNSDAVAENDIDAIWIAEGTYSPTRMRDPGDSRTLTFSLVDGVTLYGGFSGDETSLETRDWERYETVLSGELQGELASLDNADTVVYCGVGISAGMDGVTVTGGKRGTHHPEGGHGGGGIFNMGTLTVRNARVAENSVDARGRGRHIQRRHDDRVRFGD